MNEQTINEAKSTFRGITGDLLKLGLTWARYGLTMGESALRTSAQSLDGVASTLHRVAETLEKKPAAEATTEAPAGAEPAKG